jgi:hypothetical protein
MPKLTERFLAALSVDKDRKDRLVFDTVSPGLGVRVTAKGTRTFIVQWTLSFEALVDEWASSTLHIAASAIAKRRSAIKHTFADLLKRPAGRIARGEIINVLDKLVRSTKAVTAARSEAKDLLSTPDIPRSGDRNCAAPPILDARLRAAITEMTKSHGKKPPAWAATYIWILRDPFTIFPLARDETAQAPMDTAGKVHWWQPAPKPKLSLRTHGIFGVAVNILGWVASTAFAIGCCVVLAIAVIHYFQGSCSVLNCVNQVPFSNWILLLMFIVPALEYVEKLIVRRRKKQMDDTELLQ